MRFDFYVFVFNVHFLSLSGADDYSFKGKISVVDEFFEVVLFVVFEIVVLIFLERRFFLMEWGLLFWLDFFCSAAFLEFLFCVFGWGGAVFLFFHEGVHKGDLLHLRRE